MLEPTDQGYLYSFSAMASPCEVHLDGVSREEAARLGGIAEAEARRIERKYSRYREDSVVSAINRSDGWPIQLDDETAALIDHAAQCHTLSNGRFDITSGVLRRIWKLDGSDRVPDQRQVEAILPLIGWTKVLWRRPALTLRKGMEVDFGGLGKEYAVDAALHLIARESDAPALVNFGGDLRVTGPRLDGRRWLVALESADGDDDCEGFLEISEGAITTSGDARRFLLKDGVRYSHILDPRVGWPVRDPPRSVTVAAPTCMEAGLLSTLAMLYGRGAERFLQREGVKAWVVR